MIITPLAAREPYKADAAGPFNTDMLSISSGLTSMMRLLLAPRKQKAKRRKTPKVADFRGFDF
jgi:hypothetical protein